jgi:hypothetical protein
MKWLHSLTNPMWNQTQPMYRSIRRNGFKHMFQLYFEYFVVKIGAIYYTCKKKIIDKPIKKIELMAE